MTFTPTSASDSSITADDIDSREIEVKKAQTLAARTVSANTVGNEIRQSERSTPTTNSIPTSIATNWSKIAQANMTIRLYGDLLRIASLKDGWGGPKSLSLRAGSLASFLDFWMAVRNEAAEPEVTVAPDGSLYAEWYKSSNQRLDVRFAEPVVFFGLFANKSILEGGEKLPLIIQILITHPAKPLLWSAR